jgi:hypothetical protein
MKRPEPGETLRYALRHSGGHVALATVVRVVPLVSGDGRRKGTIVIAKNHAGRMLTFDFDDVYTDKYGRWAV